MWKNELKFAQVNKIDTGMVVVILFGYFVLVDNNIKVYVDMVDNLYAIVHDIRRWYGP